MDQQEYAASGGRDDLKGMLNKIGREVVELGRDHVTLARLELVEQIRRAAFDAASALLGAFLAFIALGLLCAASVVALEPAIPELWIRFLIMAGVFALVGSLLIGVFSNNLRRDLQLQAPRAETEARRTLHSLTHPKGQRP